MSLSLACVPHMFGSYINRCNHIKDMTNFVNLTFPIVSSVEKPEESQHKLSKGTRIEFLLGYNDALDGFNEYIESKKEHLTE